MPSEFARLSCAMRIAAAVALVPTGVTLAQNAIPAFSGADGAGAYTTTGGRGGIVYHVTTLDTQTYSATGKTAPAGTFQYGLNDANFPAGTPRTIVFDVGGTIWLGQNGTTTTPADYEGRNTGNAISIGSNITVAGQTAPGGITFAGGQIKINGTTSGSEKVANVIFRNVTLAPGYGTNGGFGSSGNTGTTSTSGYTNLSAYNLTYMGQSITRVYDHFTYDAMDINSQNVLVDHVSADFATDETISCNEFCANTTVQYTSMTSAQSYPHYEGNRYSSHGFSQLWSPEGDGKTSLLHNLYANNNGRNPAIQTEQTALGSKGPPLTDFRDNVLYNWYGHAGYGTSDEPASSNFVNNYYKVGIGGDSGSDTATPAFNTNAVAGTSPYYVDTRTVANTTSKTFISGNILNNRNGTNTSLTTADYPGTIVLGSAVAVPYFGVTDSALDTYNQVINYVGANWQNRDALQNRIINGVKNGTGQIKAYDNAQFGYNSTGVFTAYSTEDINNDTEWNAILRLRNVSHDGTGGTGALIRSATYDSDGDGMSDIWETAHGLNSAVADNNGDYDNNGYTNLEEYLNEVAAFPASTAIVFANNNANGRYAQIGNWGTPTSNIGVFQPSRYDTVQIDAGTAIVDAIGQHAGTLKIGTANGNTGAMNVTGGWIDVARNLNVGVAGTGSVNHSAGLVRAGTAINIGAGSSYNFSGGVLSTPTITKNSTGNFNFTGGTLHTQLVQFSLVNNGGTIAPGGDTQLQQIEAASFTDLIGADNIDSNIGNTHVQGNLTFLGGTLAIDLASANLFDTLSVDGIFTAAGSVNVTLLNGYTPTIGDYWQIAQSGTLTGSFASVTPGFIVVPGTLISSSLNPNALFLEAVPEPTSLALFSLAGLGLMRRRRASVN